MVAGAALALASALFSSLRESFRKHLSDDFSSVQVGFIAQLYGSVLLLPFAAYRYIESGLSMSLHLASAVLISSGVVIATTYLYIEAMRTSDLSMTEPLRKTTPIFVAVIEPVALGAAFSPAVAAAAFLGAGGSYIMVSNDSVLEPLENLRNRGAAISVLVALTLAVYSVAMRFGATNTDPLLFLYMTFVTGLIGFTAWMRFEQEPFFTSDLLRRDSFALGAVTAFSAVLGAAAYSLLSASEVTVIGQTSAIFGVLIGGRFFQEEGLMRKTAGAAVIISGVALAVL